MCDTTEQAETLLPMTPAAARRAREFARNSQCTDHALEVLDDALLLISELVTNSVRHGNPPLVMAIECVGDGIKVRIRDGSARQPEQGQPSEYDEGGRGLWLVEMLSQAWGVEPVHDERGTGKAVWFELRPGHGESATSR